MISESPYWKTDLLRRAILLRKCMSQKRWTAVSFAKCEQTIMIGFYSTRKLVEAKKVTNALAGRPIRVHFYQSKGKQVTRLNNHRLDALYDLSKSHKQTISLVELCHQFVHSYIFMPAFNEGGALSAILFASDRQRSKALFQIEVQTVISVFEKVARDEVNREFLIRRGLRAECAESAFHRADESINWTEVLDSHALHN
jgi:hypothetical protein